MGFFSFFSKEKKEGKTLKIGSYLKVLRERHVHYVKGETTRYANSEIFVARYQILDEMTDNMIIEIDTLVNKKIKRLEAIKRRTKKHKIKKKCDSRILEIEKRYL